MKKRTVLTNKERVELISMYGNGVSVDELSSHYKVGRSTVYAIVASKKRIKRKKVTDEAIENFKELSNAGKSYKEISQLTGYAESTISRHIGQHPRTEAGANTEPEVGNNLYLSKPLCALIQALRYEGESVPSVLTRALKSLAINEKNFDMTQEGIEELNEARDELAADRPIATEKSIEAVTLIGWAFIAAAVMALFAFFGIDGGAL